jgi:hypothetical protein
MDFDLFAPNLERGVTVLKYGSMYLNQTGHKTKQ